MTDANRFKNVKIYLAKPGGEFVQIGRVEDVQIHTGGFFTRAPVPVSAWCAFACGRIEDCKRRPVCRHDDKIRK